MRDRGTDREQGLALLEALVALVVVGVTVIGSHAVLTAALRAQSRAEATLEAVAAAAAEAERVRGGSPDAPALQFGAPPPVWTATRCRPDPATRHVTVTDPGGLVPLVVAAPAPSGPARLAVVVDDGDHPGGVAVNIRVPPAEPETLLSDPDGCIDVPSDNLVVTDVIGVDIAPPGRVIPSPSAAGAPRVLLRRTGEVRVRIAPEGREPDVIVGGTLRWWVTGDPESRTAPLGEPLRVAAGTHRIVVGVCADPRSDGAAAAAVVPSGGAVDRTVRLGVVRVEGAPVGARRLVLRRARPCPAPAERPELSWDLLDGGTMAAVPDGTWDARLVDATGRTLAGPVRVDVAGPGTVEPAWS